MENEIIILPKVLIEIEDAMEWYENRKKGLGIEFLEHLEVYFDLLKKDNVFFQIRREPNIREMPLKRFPFVIIYEVFPKKIVVYSVFNTNQNPIK